MLPRNYFLRHRYRIIRPLGKGGFGQVYEALDDEMDCIVAIKERLAQRLTHLKSEKLRRAFEREAKLLANLRHPVLPKVSAHFFESRGQYLVMEFIEGDDLATLLKKSRHPLAVEEVLSWADEVLRALEYLHNRPEPIIHRDIKPANIKLTDEGEIFLLDFGLAKGAAGSMPRPDTDQRSSSIHAFTEAYAPLEQLTNSGTNAQSDLYALGATLYHLLTGRIPIPSRTRYESLDAGQRDPQLPAHEINPNVPFSVSLALSQAMAMSRRERTASATKLRQALREALLAAQGEDRSVAVETASPPYELVNNQPTPQAIQSAHTAASFPTALSPTAPPQRGQGIAGPLDSQCEPSGLNQLPGDELPNATEPLVKEQSALAAEISWPSQLSSENIDSQLPSTIVDEEASTLSQQQLDEEHETREREEREREEREQLERQRQEAEAAGRAAEEQRLREAEAERQRLEAEQERQQAEDAARFKREAKEREAARLAEEESLRLELEEQEHREAKAAALRLSEQRAAERIRAEAERARQEEEAREEEARAAAEQQELRQEEEEKRQRAEAEAQQQEEEEANRKAEEEAARTRAAEEEHRRSEEEAARRAADLAEAQARQQAHEDETKVLSPTVAAEMEAPESSLTDKTEATVPQQTLDTKPESYMPPDIAIEPLPRLAARYRWLIGGLITVLAMGIIVIALAYIRRPESSPDNRNSIAHSNENNSAERPFPVSTALEAPPTFASTQSLTDKQDMVWSVAYSPDGKMVASGGQDGFLRVWETTAWGLKFKKKIHEQPINSVVFSPDSRVIASGSSDHTAALWSATDGALLQSLAGHQGNVLCVAFSLDGKLLASASADNTIKLWSTETGDWVTTLEGHKQKVYAVAFSPDGSTLASSDRDRTIKLWNVGTLLRSKGKQIPKSWQSSGAIYSLAFSPDGTTLASGHGEKLANGQPDGTIRLWNWRSSQLLLELKRHTNQVRAVAFSQDGSSLASSSDDNSIMLWNVKAVMAGKREPEQTLTDHRKSVQSVKFSPDGKTLISGSQDQSVIVWQ